MAIYLDSADLADARAAADFGFCEGFTTNPAWIIPYADRARRLDPEGEKLVGMLSAVVGRLGGPVRILAASLKDPGQAARAVADGAHDVTVPFEVLAALGDHPLSERAIREFDQATVAARAPASPAG